MAQSSSISESDQSSSKRNGDVESSNSSNGNGIGNGNGNHTTVGAKDAASTSWWKRSLNAAVKGGASGSIAMVLQVILLMWLRTIVNYQYRHGVDAKTAIATLYNEGGILRFYRGATLALLTGPIARFGDTASNEGVKELLLGGGGKEKSKLPVWAATLVASTMAALWRVVITPLDTLKTTLQVGSEDGFGLLREKIATAGFGVLWDGALGNSLATLAGHYPWFIVYNFLDGKLPVPAKAAKTSDGKRDRTKVLLLLRRAVLGFGASLVSDCVSNGIRVVKTYQQTAPVAITYARALTELYQANGPYFAVRGLRLKILSNGLSGILFAVLWKMILDKLNNDQNPQEQQQQSSAVAAGESKPKQS